MHKTHVKRKVNYKRILMVLAVAVLSVTMFVIPGFATSGSGVSASGMMSNLISLMCSMFKYVGAAIFVWAIIQFILATKRSDADSKSDALQTAVCGISLMAVALIINAMGLTNAVGGGSVTDDVLDKVG